RGECAGPAPRGRGAGESAGLCRFERRTTGKNPESAAISTPDGRDGNGEELRVCGIIGYVGPREAKPLLLEGLERLEYRGYDSAGLALREDDRLEYVRAVGNLANLKAAAGPNGSHARHGLGHTRWATHGGVTERNAHPLAGCDAEKVAIVLNGIVENYRELTDALKSD